MINPYLAVAVVFLVGFAIGAVNGFLIVRLGLNAFITTLAMLILLRGITIGLTNGRTLYDLPEPLLYLGNAYWLGLPAALWVSAALYRRRQPDPRAITASAAPSTRSAGTRRRHAPPASPSTATCGPCSSSPAVSPRCRG